MLSKFALALLLFLLAAGWLGWFTVTNTFLGVVALVTSILILVEGVPVVRDRYLR